MKTDQSYITTDELSTLLIKNHLDFKTAGYLPDGLDKIAIKAQIFGKLQLFDEIFELIKNK